MAACDKCPWIHEKSLITPQLLRLAKADTYFCCHIDMHQCRGAVLVGAALRSKKLELVSG